MANRLPQSKQQRVMIEKFGGMQTNTGKISIADNEFSLLVNAMPISDGNISSIPSYTEAFTVNANACVRATNLIINGKLNTYTFDGLALWENNYIIGGFNNPRLTVWQGTILLIIDTTGYYSWDGITLTQQQIFASIQGCITTYMGRVWISQNKTVIFSAPNSYTDFSVEDGAGFFVLTGGNLRTNITGFAQNDNLLYIFGDHSINVISGIQEIIEPLPQLIDTGSIMGAPNQETIINYNNFILFANDLGIYTIKGLEITKISNQLNGIWANLEPLTASQATINGVTVYLLYCAVLKPISNLITNDHIILAFYNDKWFIIITQDGQISRNDSDMPLYQYNYVNRPPV